MIEWLQGAPGDPEIVLAGRPLPILLKRNARARRLTLRLARDGSAVHLTVPRWAPTREAIAFAHAKSEWLAGQLEKIPQRDPPQAGGTFRYCGEDWRIDWHAAHPRTPRTDADAGTLTLGGPQDRLPARLQRWLESEALRLCAADLAFYAGRAGVPLPEIRLSRAKSRWGSCSGKQVVRINWRLVQAPAHVRRSVVAHEVAHLVHFDHSPAFHALLGQIYDADIAAADRWLKAHGRGLYAQFG